MKKILSLLVLCIGISIIKGDCGCVKRPRMKSLALGPRTALFVNPDDVLFQRIPLFEPRYAGDEFYQV